MNENKNWLPEFNKFVNEVSFIKPTNETNESAKIKYRDFDIGRFVGFSRLAPHFVILPPHSRSSFPHAESLEEEFVFVIRGQPHLWLNGYIHDLNEGYAVGFPSGTGIAHAIINNSDQEVHLLVAGEKTKNDNKCFFPLNTELKEVSTIWWDNAPQYKLGPHNGLPGVIKDNERASEKSEFIVNCFLQEQSKSFNYPGDNETFGEGFRISDKIGLRKLGIWFEKLPAGHRSAFPHAHTHEEEFVFVLNGKPTVWLNGFSKDITSQHFAAFHANTGIAHTLINDTSEEINYICIGESEDFVDEKISYPLHPLRIKECQRKGFYWNDLHFDSTQYGDHSGSAKIYPKEHLKFKICELNNVDELLEFFKKNETQNLLTVNRDSLDRKSVTDDLLESPKDKDEFFFKELLILEFNQEPIGVVNLYVHHPIENQCNLKLFHLKKELFNSYLGQKIYQLTEEYILRALLCNKIILEVPDEDNENVFWQKMGFSFNSYKECWKNEKTKHIVRVFEKEIS